jgi:hypothetical protein
MENGKLELINNLLWQEICQWSMGKKGWKDGILASKWAISNMACWILDHLRELSSFPTWLRASIALAIQGGDTIDQKTIHMSMSPTLKVRSYQSMYAFGNHIRVVSVEEHLTTNDSGV